MAIRFSDVLEQMGPSDLGPLLALTAQPDIISFAGGLPAPKTFPLKELTEVAIKVREEDGAGAMQYGPSLGFLGLREAIADRMNKMYMPMGMEKVEAKNIMVVTGSQQGLDITGRVFLNKGDVVLCESPTYLGAIGAFDFEQPRYIEVPTDDDGIIPEELEKYLESTPNVKFIYVIPNYQNPTGRCMSLERRKKMMEIVTKYEIPVFEDNPYGDLRVAGEDVPNIKSFDEDGIVIYSGSFSKILAPGIRIGFTVAPAPVAAKMTVGKQAVDVHTTQLMQMVVAEWMKRYDVDEHIEKIREIYRRKLNLMCDMIDSELGDAVSYVRPEGGLFIWCELPEDIDALEFVKRSAANMVALVPGTAFLTDVDGKSNAVRLNFSTPADDKITEGMKILGRVLKEMRGE